MPNKLSKQEEIDALLNSAVEAPQPVGADLIPAEEQPGKFNEEDDVVEPAKEQCTLKEEDKDALGEIGNICMGSAATTLSTLLSQKVEITSPRISITTLEDLFKGFAIPHMTIYVRFTEGLSGYNLLIMKLQDAAILADLMMGGDGTNVSGELTEIGVSAASEAMNQMIGSASTAMATMFSRTVNISPPETKIYQSAEELQPLDLVKEEPVVVVWFKMIVGDILDTQIMQVMSIETAREEANLILGELMQVSGGEPAPVEGEADLPATFDYLESATAETVDDLAGAVLQELAEPEPVPTPQAPKQQKVPPSHEQLPYVDSATPTKGKEAILGFNQQRLDMILDIPLKVTVLLGRTRWPIKDILGLSPGSVVEMLNLVDEPVEVLVNGTLVAMGEVVVVNENFGVRITNIIGPEERLQNLRK